MLLFSTLATFAWAGATENATLQHLVDELVPLVEEAAGARFDTVPEVVFANAEELTQVVYEEQVHLLKALTDIDDAQAQASARDTAASVAHIFAGKYGFLDKKLYLSIDGIAEALAIHGAPPGSAGPMAKVVLAHELAHALQDQQVDLASVVTSAETADAVMATNCLVEGHAVWVHEAVAQELGLHDASELMSQILGYRDAGLPDHPDSFYTAYVYGLGRDFTAWHSAMGGTDHMWRVLANPPLTTDAIVHPERYQQVAEVEPKGLRRSLGRASRRLGRKSWARRTQPLGDYDVRDQLVRAGSGPHLADRIEEAWHARSTGGPMLGIEVQVLRFAQPTLAQAYVLSMGRNAAFQAAAVSRDDQVDASSGVFEAVVSDASARESIDLRMQEGPHQLGTVWLAQAGDVVQIVTVNQPVSDRRIARAVRPVLRRLRQDAPEPERVATR